jgi:hypothetical protein
VLSDQVFVRGWKEHRAFGTETKDSNRAATFEESSGFVKIQDLRVEFGLATCFSLYYQEAWGVLRAPAVKEE